MVETKKKEEVVKTENTTTSSPKENTGSNPVSRFFNSTILK
jgi:hypothetical protein